MNERELRDALEKEPWSFGFFQAVTLLERMSGRAPIGRWAHPETEAVHISTSPSVSFPPAEIKSLEVEPGRPARLEITFMGLVGSMGVLPLEYSMLVARAWREGRRALRDFLDIFQHRILSLFYGAWRRNRFGLDPCDDRLAAHALDLVGAGPLAMRTGLAFDARTLAFYSGLLAMGGRGASSLEAVVADYFRVQTEVEQFVGSWHSLSHDTGLVLGDYTLGSQLGAGAVVGDEVWDPQAIVRVRIGPVDRTTFESFLPGGESHEPLRSLVRFFGRGEVDFELRLVLARDAVMGVRLGDAGQRLGYGSWIAATPFGRDGEETIVRL